MSAPPTPAPRGRRPRAVKRLTGVLLAVACRWAWATAVSQDPGLQGELADLERQSTHQPVEAARTLAAWQAAHRSLGEHDSLFLELIRANIANSQYRSDDVLAISDAIAARLQALDDPRLSAFDLHLRGSAYYELGRDDEAWRAVDAEQRQAERARDSDAFAMAMINRVRLQVKRGDYAGASEAIANAEQGALGSQAGAELAYAKTVLEQNLDEWDVMLAASVEAGRRFAEVHDQTGVADALAASGEALAQLGRPADGVDSLQRATAIYRQVGDAPGEAVAQLLLARAWDGAGQRARALALSAQALATLGALDEPWQLAQARVDRASVLVDADRAAEALAQLELARPVILVQQDLRALIRLHVTSARTLAALGRYPEAYRALEQARAAEARRTGLRLTQQLAAQRGRIASAQLAKENSLLRDEAESTRQSLAAAARAARFQQLALALGGVIVAGALLAARRQRKLTRRIEDLARTDHLTGIANRRTVLEQGQALIDRCVSAGAASAVLMIDVDRFKEVNDRYGHLAGDRALRAVAQVLQRCLRPVDLLCRYGGEEFLAILPDIGAAEAAAAAERVRLAVAALPADWAPGARALTISGGIALTDTDAFDLNDLLAGADRALYRAKALGRDRIELADRDESADSGV